jgi:hypothetical protein
MATPLEILRWKHVALTATEKRLLISKLTLDEKRFLGNLLIDNEINIESDIEELEPEDDLQFGNRTYVDGLHTWVSNKE